MELFLFFILSLIVMAGAVLVVMERNPLYSALALVANLVGVAGLFAMLEAHFLATVQIIVYAGAIMVLVIFVLMLLNSKDEERERGTWYYMFPALVAAVLFVVMLSDGFKEIHFAELPVEGSVRSIGQLVYTKFIFPFEAASLLIMAAIVGAVMIGKRGYRAAKEE